MNEWIFVKNNYVKSMYFFMCVCLYWNVDQTNDEMKWIQQQDSNTQIERKIESETKK